MSVYPSSLDNFTSSQPSSTTDVPGTAGNGTGLAAMLNNYNDSITAIEAKLGVTGSAVNTTVDYKLSGVTTGDKAMSKTGTETATNKTFTSPVLNSPSIATASAIGIANATFITGRNAANSANINIVEVNGSNYIIVGQPFYMSSGTQKGITGLQGGEEGVVPVRLTSASNKNATKEMFYPHPFLAAPSLTINNELILVSNSNSNVVFNCTKSTYHLINADGFYVGFGVNYQDNTDFTANQPVVVAFSWSATV